MSVVRVVRTTWTCDGCGASAPGMGEDQHRRPDGWVEVAVWVDGGHEGREGHAHREHIRSAVGTLMDRMLVER